MNYISVKIKGKTYWSADPKTWEELAFTINNEEPFLDHHPESEESYKNNALVKMFLEE